MDVLEKEAVEEVWWNQICLENIYEALETLY